MILPCLGFIRCEGITRSLRTCFSTLMTGVPQQARPKIVGKRRKGYAKYFATWVFMTLVRKGLPQGSNPGSGREDRLMRRRVRSWCLYQ